MQLGDYVRSVDLNGIERRGVVIQGISETMINVLALDEEYLRIYMCRQDKTRVLPTTSLDNETFQLYAALNNYLAK
jgi:hypothetical protein